MAKVIMVQGTMSGVGKSLLVAGLCRMIKRDGYRVAPFKSQNMSLNSFVTEEGLEMGRAQVMQAEAAGRKPMVCMNPILLKPTSHTGSQVIVNGEVLGNMSAREYFAYKKKLIPDIKRAFQKLEETVDIIVIEGAGSPAEVNLKEQDIVNMGLAELVDAPVLLVGDIDRGGVFAQLLGTLMLLEEEERKRVKGLVINKFRGDSSLLDSGIAILEDKGKIPVIGVIPYMELALEEEDSLTERFERTGQGCVEIVVVRYPRISNFTDFFIFEQMPDVAVRYITSAKELGHPDLVFLPGSKNTMGDLKWMRQNGLEAAVKKLAEEGVPICGICGGYQMMGRWIFDPEGVEEGGRIEGMELLPVGTKLKPEKIRRQVQGTIHKLDGVFSVLSGLEYNGYEIHMGKTSLTEKSMEKQQVKEEKMLLFGNKEEQEEGLLFGSRGDRVGTYIHGLFDKGNIASALVRELARRKGVQGSWGTDRICEDYSAVKEREYDKLADILSEHLNLEEIYGVLQESTRRFL